jgi:hypothetical protein
MKDAVKLYIVDQNEDTYFVKYNPRAAMAFTIDKKEVEDHSTDYYIYKENNQFFMLKERKGALKR